MPSVLVSSAAHILSDYLITSEGTHCYGLFERMAAYGYQFEALSPYVRVRRPLGNTHFHQVGSFRMSPTSSAFARYALHSEFLLRGLFKARQILREKNIEIVHHMLPAVLDYSFSPLALAATNLKKPFIFGPISVHYHKRPASQRVFLPLTSRLHKATIQKCDRIITVTEHAKKLYAKLIGEERIAVIPFGVDTELFSPTKEKAQSEGFEVLYVGSLYPLKGVHHLILAIADVRSNGLKANLTIVGEGRQEQELKALVKATGIEEHVHFIGFVPYSSMPNYYRRCDVFCLPSWVGESFGKAIVEAMACGKPVISTNMGGPAEMIENHVNGVLVPPSSPRTIAQEIIRLANDEKGIRRMGEKARETALQRFSWDVIAQKYHQLYSELL